MPTPNPYHLALAADSAYRHADIEKGGTEVKIDDFGSYCIVAFRGTENIADWMTDAKVRMVAFNPGGVPVGEARVHRGFYGNDGSDGGEKTGYCAVRDDVIAAIGGNRRRRKLFICGHSKGGAEAACCAADLSRWHDVQLDTFGAPDPGNDAFAELFGTIKARRWVYGVDLVAYMPPLPGYSPVGTLQQLGGWWSRMNIGFLYLRRWAMIGRASQQHPMQKSYLPSLKDKFGDKL